MFAERAFVKFVAALSESFERVVLVGRLDPTPGSSHYPLPPEVEFVALPHYPSLASPPGVARAAAGSMRVFWRVLGDVDCVWILGPHPLGMGFAPLATLRGRAARLGVRQDLPEYVRTRHPGNRRLKLMADALEGAWRLLARAYPVAVVGPRLAENYRGARDVLELTVSLVSRDQLAPPELAERRTWDGELTVLSVGRLEAEKNPLLLAEVLGRLDERWRMVICGEGPLLGDLERRLAELGVSERAELVGYMPIDGGLLDLYRDSHAFLHVSWTEGLPQVLFEAFAARLPLVATAVGGVAPAAEGASLLVPPGDAAAAAGALQRMAADAELRERLVAAGAERVAERTLEAEAARLARFLAP